MCKVMRFKYVSPKLDFFLKYCLFPILLHTFQYSGIRSICKFLVLFLVSICFPLLSLILFKSVWTFGMETFFCDCRCVCERFKVHFGMFFTVCCFHQTPQATDSTIILDFLYHFLFLALGSSMCMYQIYQRVRRQFQSSQFPLPSTLFDASCLNY